MELRDILGMGKDFLLIGNFFDCVACCYLWYWLFGLSKDWQRKEKSG